MLERNITESRHDVCGLDPRFSATMRRHEMRAHSEVSRWGWLFCALALASSGTLLAPLNASAQPVVPTGDAVPAAPAVDDKQRGEAKERFLRGLELAAQDNWDAALVEFMASRELFPTRAAISNIPLSLRHLKRYAEAIVAYNELLQKFGPSLPTDERKKVDEALGELRAYVGEIDVESDQKDSTVVIDGQQRGTTPLPTPIVVNAGTHVVRVSREGFESYEAQVPVAGKQRKLIGAKLRRLARSGLLVVREASEQVLDVLIDGAAVGKTPWQGTLAVGTHGVALRGLGEIGSPPAAATVKESETATVTLAARKLDARVRVEPLPASARVDIDGVAVGAGIWEGRLESGSHRIEVYAPGHVPYRREISISSGRTEVVHVALERDLANPMWAVGFRPHLFVEATGGLELASSLGLGADAACDRQVTLPSGSVPGCRDRSRPFGFVAGARGGYQLTSGLGLEVFLGYLAMSESMTRAIVATGETRGTQQLSFSSADARDSTNVSGPLGALSASYAFFERTPLRFRLWAGVMRARVKHGLKGTFAGEVPYAVAGMDKSLLVEQGVDVAEPARNVWVPLVGPEVRFGYRVSRRLVIDVGVAGFLFFGPSESRRGGNIADSTSRSTSLTEVQSPEGARVTPGVIDFPIEKSLSTFFGVMPTLGVRLDL